MPLFETFLDAIATRDRAGGPVDARVPLVLSLVTLACILISRQPVFPLTVFVATVALAARSRVPLRFFLSRLGPAFLAAFLVVVLHVLLVGKIPLTELCFRGFRLPFGTREGTARGLLLGSRILGGMGVVVLLASTSPAYAIFRAARWLRVPEAWIELATLVYRHVFTLAEVATAVWTAQRTRLGHAGFSRTMRSMGMLTGTVLVRAMDQAFRTHEAMLLRGYRGASIAPSEALSGRGWAQVLAGTAGMTVLLALFDLGMPR